ncbi:MAG: ATP synthase F0 subunit B [Syntrophobacterales bacterium]|nr:ATP synthase F0 subunit B [Syntrophobacterales bacterium]
MSMRMVKALPLMVLLVGVAGVALAGGGGEHGGVTEAKMQDLIWRTFNFIVFAAILIKLAVRPAKEFFATRAQSIAQNLEELEAKKQAAAAALAAAEARLKEVEKERERLIQQFVAEGELEKAAILKKAEMVAQRIKEMARMTIEAETKRAAQELKREVAEQATRLAEEMIRQKLTFTDHQRLVEEYLEKVVEKH